MKKFLVYLTLVAFSLFLVACFSDSDSTADADADADADAASDDAVADEIVAAITTLAGLPEATGEVSSGSSSSLFKVKNTLSATGFPLGSVTEADFGETSSLAACEMFNMTKTSINEAAQGDLIQCYVTSTFEAATPDTIDIYDGEYHHFDLVFPEGEDDGGPDHVKFKIGKDADGNINLFEMFSCQGGSQDMYLIQEIDGTDFSMTFKMSGSEGAHSFADTATVTGTLNADGEFVDEVDGVASPKEIHMQHSGSSTSGDDFWGDMTFYQYSDHGTLTGTMGGTHIWTDPISGVSSSCSSSILTSSYVVLNDGNPEGEPYEIGLLEMGDGAASVSDTGSCDDGGSWEHSVIEAWSEAGAIGQALSDPTSSAYYAEVSDAVLTAASEPTISFGDDTYDCGTAAEATINFGELASAGSNPMESCARLEMSHNHINCWQLIGEQQQE